MAETYVRCVCGRRWSNSTPKLTACPECGQSLEHAIEQPLGRSDRGAGGVAGKPVPKSLYAAESKEELVELAADRGLAISGNKAAIVERLEASDAAATPVGD
jgi:predicted  nucleic acid-binding Zn-ribbon protein